MRNPNLAKVVVGANDSIPDVLTRLRTATGGNATLAIPAASSLFLTASEFRALRATVDQSRITLTVETDDRLRKQLATMFQIPVVDLLPGAVSTLEEPPPPPPAPEEPPKLPSVLPDLPKLDLPPAKEVAPKWEPREPDSTDENGLEPLPERKRRSIPIQGKKLGIGVGAVLLIAALALVAAYFLQTATVAITVKRQPVTADLTYAVVSSGAKEPDGAVFSIQASPVTLEVPYRETIPVTGELREPDQIAAGNIALRNPTDAPIEIAAGTSFAAKDGVEYVFASEVTVPAADASNGAGRAEGQVRAAIGGENANREIGMLSGKLENGVYYSNRDSIVAGGSDKITRVVDQKDIDQLVANANAQLPQRIIGAPLQDGRVVLPGSVQAGELDYTTDHQAGDVVESVTIEATMVLSAMAFAPGDAVAQATNQLQSDLQANTPAGFELESQTVTFADPVLVNDQGNAGLYTLTANASARAVIDDSQRDAVAEAIAGMDVDKAEAYLKEQPFVERAEISSSPGFLPKRVPGNAGRIEIQTS
jgi:hypothetical protein